jgi:hypothetical protein
MFYQTLSVAPGQPGQSESVDSPIWYAALAPLAISAIIRWLVLPRARSSQPALTLFIVGIAMAESACFMGLYVFPAHKHDLFLLSMLGIFQFIPYYARRYFPPDDEQMTA